jgi:CubicO group peptidase (beta-lactamase class C family)
MSKDLAIQGRCDEKFAAVKAAFEANVRERDEIGAAVAVAYEGELVVDLWAGHADQERTRPWERDTLVNVYSTTKGMTALCAHRLVEEGRLDLDAPVADYWPGFAQAGKAQIPVRQLLCHQAGLAAVAKILPGEALYDWDAMCEALAAQEPWWEPGTAHGYHAVTFGWLVGEVVRRITGESLGTTFRKMFAEPLGLDFHIGLAEEEHGRVAELVALDPTAPEAMDGEAAALAKAFLEEPEGVTARAFVNPPTMALGPNNAAWRKAEIPGANGHGTARALATIYGHVALGDGKVIGPESVERCRAEHSFGPDRVLGVTTRFGLGFMLPGSTKEAGSTLGEGSFGHPGAGGSLGIADPEARLGLGYVMNRMGPRILLDDRAIALTEAATACAKEA